MRISAVTPVSYQNRTGLKSNISSKSTSNNVQFGMTNQELERKIDDVIAEEAKSRIVAHFDQIDMEKVEAAKSKCEKFVKYTETIKDVMSKSGRFKRGEYYSAPEYYENGEIRRIDANLQKELSARFDLPEDFFSGEKIFAASDDTLISMVTKRKDFGTTNRIDYRTVLDSANIKEKDGKTYYAKFGEKSYITNGIKYPCTIKLSGKYEDSVCEYFVADLSNGNYRYLNNAYRAFVYSKGFKSYDSSYTFSKDGKLIGHTSNYSGIMPKYLSSWINDDEGKMSTYIRTADDKPYGYYKAGVGVKFYEDGSHRVERKPIFKTDKK